MQNRFLIFMIKPVVYLLFLFFSFSNICAQRFSVGLDERIAPSTLLADHYFSVPFESSSIETRKFDFSNNASFITLLYDDKGLVHHLLWQTALDGHLIYLALSKELKEIFYCTKPLAYFHNCIQEIKKNEYTLDPNRGIVGCVVKRLNFCAR